MMFPQPELHAMMSSSSDGTRLPRTWETVLEFVALIETMPDSEWAQHAPQLRQLADEIVRETADFPRPVPVEVQRFIARCAP